MEKISTPFPDVWLIKPRVFHDNRGFFLESYSYKKFCDIGIDIVFRQDNHSKSVKNTVRGLHFQINPGQTKLVRCVVGKIWDVMVDIRPESPTFKQWWGVELSAENFLQVCIPKGFAHGFSVLSETAEIQYKVDEYYNPQLERGILWNDPEIHVDWKVESPILSTRDKKNPSLREYLS
ncbi:MAG: dTDP-4-dehydrorhamnose 3,5-epimerase [Candidatus Lokiarchaeota archaeon]|nr:dTDP-4-dehydrorhamnose 3,5-epimerase [Candidatus Harpocratesius repetitus]